jgi:putative nucleotidyltransferase with HDIG domain
VGHGYMIRKVLLKEILPGMELGTEVLLPGNGRMLEEGTVLTTELLARFKKEGIASLDIRQREEWPDILAKSLNEPAEKKRFMSVYMETVQSVKDAFQDMRVCERLSMDEMERLVQGMILPMLNYRGIIHNLYELHACDEYTFHHSVKVALLCGVIGKWMGYEEAEIRQLSLAGLLHDVGKSRIPLELLTKPGKLDSDEMAIMKQHVTKGYELLQKSGVIVAWPVACAVLQHHERMDGSGYPHRTCGAELHPYAKIVAVADVYDAMTSDRVYRKRHTPFKVLKTLTEEMFGKLDPDVCTTFMNNIRDYLIGNRVKLSDGRLAEVVALHHPMATRPVVRTQAGDFIDLESEKDIVIIEIINA